MSRNFVIRYVAVMLVAASIGLFVVAIVEGISSK